MEQNEFLFGMLWERRWRILAAMLLGTAVAFVYVVAADRMYIAELIAVPARHDQSLSGNNIGGALGGLGAIVGIGSGSNEQTSEGLAILRSRSLIEEFIAKEDLLPILFESEWDASTSSWKDASSIPSLWDGYRLFSDRVFSVSENVQQRIIVVRVVWNDSSVAANWANSLLEMANDRARQQTIVDSRENVEFLRNALVTNALQEIRQSIFSLIVSQIRHAMIANTRTDYAFKVIDPAKKKDAEAYDYPRMSVLIPIGAIVGPAFYLFLVLAGLLFTSHSTTSRTIEER